MPVVQWVSSEAEWDNHKARIWNLYLGDDKPLKDVMFIMQHEHGFKARSRPLTMPSQGYS